MHSDQLQLLTPDRPQHTLDKRLERLSQSERRSRGGAHVTRLRALYRTRLGFKLRNSVFALGKTTRYYTMAISGPVSIKKPAASARRCLFGPPDHQRIRKDLDRALSEMERSTKASLKMKWGFDAETETGVPGGRYEYSEVSSTDYVPQCYRKGYTTRSRRVTPRVDSASQMELEDLPVLPTTVSTSTQAGQGLDNPSAVSRTIIGVRRLDFKENCVLGSTSTPSSVSTQRASRSSQRSSSVPSSLLQSTMTDHFQPRKRRSPECDSSLPRGKSPRM